MRPTKLIAFLLFILSIHSCDDIFNDEHLFETRDRPFLRDGRLIFRDKQQLSQYMEYLKEDDERALLEFSNFYDKGFYSFRHLISSDDETRINRASDRIMELVLESRGSDARNARNEEEVLEEFINEREDIIGDDEYAGVINELGEIQMADSIYKYTPTGLYFVHEDDIDYLNEYLNDIEKDSTSINGRLVNPNIIPPGITAVDLIINRFLSPLIPAVQNSGKITSKSYNVQSEQSLEEYLDNLTPCNPQRGIWAFVFGSSRYCTSYFENKERVKTKFWNQNYLIFRSVGLVVKRQKKRVWIWWSTKAPEIQLRMNNVFMEFDIPVQSIITNAIPEYIVFEDKIYNGEGHIIKSNFGNSIPKAPFGSPLEIVVNLPFYGIFEANYSTKKLNKLFWEKLHDRIEKLFKEKLNVQIPDEALYVGLMESKMFLSYKDETNIEKNKSKARKTFDWQLGLGVKIGIGPNNSTGKFDLGDLILPRFYNYKNISIDVYGVARRGDSYWKGDRVIWNE